MACRRQAIIWTSDGILLIRNFNQNWNIVIEENAFANVVRETAAILSRPQCFKDMLVPVLLMGVFVPIYLVPHASASQKIKHHGYTACLTKCPHGIACQI